MTLLVTHVSLTMKDLPEDILLHILSWLSPSSLYKFSQLCHSSNNISLRHEETIWKPHVLRINPHPQNSDQRWKIMYEQLYNLRHGRFTFQMHRKSTVPQNTTERFEFLKQHSQQMAQKKDQCFAICGQPIEGVTRFSVGLVFCGSYLFWIHENGIAFASTKTYLYEHVSLFETPPAFIETNQKDLVLIGTTQGRYQLVAWSVPEMIVLWLVLYEFWDVSLVNGMDIFAGIGIDHCLYLMNAKTNQPLSKISLLNVPGVNESWFREDMSIVASLDYVIVCFDVSS
jgi:hypothetical protein